MNPLLMRRAPQVGAGGTRRLGTECLWRRQEGSQGRSLPEDQKALHADKWRSEEFEPSLSFRGGEGWTKAPPASSEYPRLQRGAMGRVLFLRVKEVYEPTRGRNPIMTAQGNKDTVVGLDHEVVTGRRWADRRPPAGRQMTAQGEASSDENTAEDHPTGEG